MRGRPLTAVALFALLEMTASPVVAVAQEPPAESRAARPGGRGPVRGGRPPLPPNPDVMTAQQVEKYFEDVMLFQARNQLALTDAQFVRFGAGLAQLQSARRQQQRRRMMLLRDLNQLLMVRPLDDAAVTAKMNEIDDAATDYARQVQDAYTAIDRVLDLRQRARFRIFDENMERRKLDLLARARQAAQPAATPPAATEKPAR